LTGDQTIFFDLSVENATISKKQSYNFCWDPSHFFSVIFVWFPAFWES